MKKKPLSMTILTITSTILIREKRKIMDFEAKYSLMSPQPHDFHIGFKSFYNFYTMRPHWHEHLEFTYITSGVGQFIIDGEVINVHAGDLLFVAPNRPHTLLSSRGVDFDCLLMRTELFTEDELSKMNFKSLIRGDERVNRLLYNIKEEYSNDADMSEMNKKALAFSLIVHLIRNHNVKPDSEEENRIRAEWLSRIKVVEKYISENYKNKITVSELARLLYVSDGHFCRFFKRHMGISAIEYLNVYRVSKALDLLRDRALSITDVALQTGFDDVNYFSRVFKKIRHQTPTEYRFGESKS